MAREPEDLAELRRGLGAQLAVHRTAAELTQDRLAQAAFRDRTTVAHIEKGRARGDERFWTIADELCGADGVLLAAFHVVAAAQQAHEGPDPGGAAGRIPGHCAGIAADPAP